MDVTNDAGALIAADRNNRSFWALHAGALKRGYLITVPAPVVVQVWRTDTQVLMARLLNGCLIESLTPEQARRVGVLAASTGVADVVDLTVAEGALRRGRSPTSACPPPWRATSSTSSRRCVPSTRGWSTRAGLEGIVHGVHAVTIGIYAC